MGAAKKEDIPPVPVTLLSGFLGAGKTTLLKNILEQTHNRPGEEPMKVAVLVNDMAAVNIDSALVSNTRVLQAEEKMVELHNGCICCTLRGDLVKALGGLASEGKYDAIVVESTGVSDPQEVAETFATEVGDGGGAPGDWEMDAIVKALRGKDTLNEVARLDTCVTVVDCAAFDADLTTSAELQERFEGSADDGDDRSVAPLLMSQIEFADVVVLSKCDLLSPQGAAAVEGAVRALNPGAKVVRALRGDVPLSQVLRTGLFSMERASQMAGWMAEMKGEPAVPETEVYGISSFVYRARTPFHPLRFAEFLDSHWVLRGGADDADGGEEEEEKEEGEGEGMESEGGECAMEGEREHEHEHEHERKPAELSAERRAAYKEREAEAKAQAAKTRAEFGNVMRSKGFVWLAGRDEQTADWSQAGAVGQFSCGGAWMATLPKAFWPDEGTEQWAEVMADFDGPVLQDRRQEIVFIGQNLKEDAIRAALDECLLTHDDLVCRRGRSAVASEHAWKMGVRALQDPFPAWPPNEF